MFRCLCTLADLPHEGYSPSAARRLAGGNRKFPHRLTFNRTDVVAFRSQSAEHMSISGVQDKISLKLRRGILEPTEQDGEFILKPVPAADIPRFKGDVPANEHLTMQIAAQAFGIPAAINACIRFADGEKGDQVRITTPEKAKEIGSDYIVVGRPITAAPDPVAAYERCIKEFVD